MSAPKEVLHLFRECEGNDVYAARDLEHAKALYKADTSENPDEFTDWKAEPDDKSITVDCDGKKVTKTAAEWANDEMTQAGHCFGENY